MNVHDDGRECNYTINIRTIQRKCPTTTTHQSTGRRLRGGEKRERKETERKRGKKGYTIFEAELEIS
jgi:hypothetical protein